MKKVISLTIIKLLADDLYIKDEYSEFGNSRSEIIERFTKKAREV